MVTTTLYATLLPVACKPSKVVFIFPIATLGLTININITDDIVKDAGQDPNQEAMRKARIGRFQPQTTLKSQNSAGSAKSAK